MDSMLSTSAYSYSHSLTGSVMQQFEHPTARLLQDSGFRPIRYPAWKLACLEERVSEGALCSPNYLPLYYYTLHKNLLVLVPI